VTGKYRTIFLADARAQLRKIDRVTAMTILRKLTELQTDPYAYGTTEVISRPGHRRLRVGDYRVVYRIDGGRVVIVVVAVGHRGEIYDQ
jgi:mRNA interferase RelE/StbE